MPPKGTKLVKIAGEPVFLPEREAEIERLLQEGCELQAVMEDYKTRLQAVKDRLAELAQMGRGDRGTVDIEGASGRAAKVTWRKKTLVDAAGAETLRDVLGEDWGRVFNVRASYSLSRGYKGWVKTCKDTGAKARVASTISVKESAPAVTIKDVAEG